MPTPTQRPIDRSKLLGLEALRGLLAVWVVIAHVTSRVVSDATIASAHFQRLLEPLTPVYVFVILSGFVIFLLLDRERPTYGAFVTRRVFRLLPLYFVVLAVAASLAQFELRTLDNLFMRNVHLYDAIKVHQEALSSFWPHLWIHVFVLQGLVPDNWLPDANFTFLSQGWSVSLEVQFYLIAPLLFWLIQKRKYLILSAIAAGLAGLHLSKVQSVGFLPNQVQYFAAGIASYYLYRQSNWYSAIPARAQGAGFLAAGILFVMLLPNPLPMLIWLFTLWLLLGEASDRQGALNSNLSRLLEQPLLQWLGKISYSIYLVHIPILYLVFRAITKVEPHMGGWKFLVVTLPGTLLCSVLVAAATHHLIERPGIEAGRRIAARMK